MSEQLNQLLARQTRVEERLERIERTLPQPPPPAVAPPSALAPAQTRPIFSPKAPALETKFGLTILNRIGVITLLLGVAFLFKWSADNNWIGATGRVFVGLMAGLLTVGLGDILWRKEQKVFAQGVTGAGVAILYISIYAAFDFYHIIPQVPAFVLLVLITALTSTLAIRYNAAAIAVLGFVGAYLIPLLLSASENQPWFLLSYLLALNFASDTLAGKRNWRLLEMLSFSATVLIFGSWLLTNASKPQQHLVATIGVLALGAQRFRTFWPTLLAVAQVLSTLSLLLIWRQSNHFAWLSLLVAAGSLTFAHRRLFRPVVLTAVTSFWITAGFWSVDMQPSGKVMAFAIAGFLLFSIWTWWRSAVLRGSSSPLSLIVFALNGICFYALVYSALQANHHPWLGPLALATGATYLAFGVFHRRRLPGHNPDIVQLASGMSIGFLSLAIPIQLSGLTVTSAWSIQAAALSWIAVRSHHRRTLVAAVVVFILAFLRIAILDAWIYPDAHNYSLLVNLRFFTFALLAVSLLLASYWSSNFRARLAVTFFVTGHLIMLTGLSFEVFGWAKRSAAPVNLVSTRTIGVTILFAVYAVVLVSFGVTARSRGARLLGLVLTGAAILKLYAFDVWQLGRFYQIVVFVGLGILLLSTSFLYSRFRELLDEWRKDDAATAPH